MNESPFVEYEVEGIGTVIAPEGELGYRVRLLSGTVTAYPAQSGEPSEANAAADIAYALANPTLPAQSQQQIYDGQLAPGYLDVATGIRLKSSERAQARFAQMVTLTNLAVSAGLMSDITDVSIWDFNDVEQTLPLADFRSLILRYGLYCKALFDAYAP